MPADQPHFTLDGLTRSHAVVQAGRPILLRGRATPHATVAATLGDTRGETRADATGRWTLRLPAREPGATLHGRVECEGHVLTLDDIHVGEVWFCGGQSNMAMSLAGTVPGEAVAPGSDPLVRFTATPARVAAEPLEHAEVHWLAGDQHPKAVSAVGIHFARRLRAALGRPVGFVQSAIGHTPAMSWTRKQDIASGSTAAKKLAEFHAFLDAHPDACQNLDAWRERLLPGFARWNKAITNWQPAARALLAEGKPFPPMPERETGPGDPHTPTVLHNAMIAPYQGEAFAGVLWYQGESDAILGLHDEYGRSLDSLLHSLRATLGDLPIVLVELPRHYDIQCADPDAAWPAVRWAQQRALHDGRVGVVPTLDLGDTDRIHPIEKRELAHRAGDIALHLAYHGPGRRHGPIFHDAQFLPDRVRVRFSGVEGSLSARGSDARNAARFESAGPDGRFHPAIFSLVSANEVDLAAPHATAVRYAWAGDPLPTLFDASGWPVSPFLALASQD